MSSIYNYAWFLRPNHKTLLWGRKITIVMNRAYMAIEGKKMKEDLQIVFWAYHG
jgi:hypothetical protein